MIDKENKWGRLRPQLYEMRDDFNFPIVNFPFQQHLHMDHISPSWSDIPELVVSLMNSMIVVAANTKTTGPRVASG
jgi:hypothetical protein